MIVAIHQPNYIPYLGYFYKILKADVFVFLDTVQFSRGHHQNRNMIKTPSGPLWLTQPVPHKKGVYQMLGDLEFAESGWQRAHLKTISRYYKTARAFGPFFERLQAAYSSIESNRVVEFNIALNQQIASWLGLNARFVRASELPPVEEGDASLLNASICRSLGADCYLSGGSGRSYMDESVFEAMGIEVIYSDFQHPIYPQLSGEFAPNMSVVDLLLNCGEASAHILAGRKSVAAR